MPSLRSASSPLTGLHPYDRGLSAFRGTYNTVGLSADINPLLPSPWRQDSSKRKMRTTTRCQASKADQSPTKARTADLMRTRRSRIRKPNDEIKTRHTESKVLIVNLPFATNREKVIRHRHHHDHVLVRAQHRASLSAPGDIESLLDRLVSRHHLPRFYCVGRILHYLEQIPVHSTSR